MNAHIYY